MTKILLIFSVFAGTIGGVIDIMLKGSLFVILLAVCLIAVPLYPIVKHIYIPYKPFNKLENYACDWSNPDDFYVSKLFTNLYR